MTKIEEITRLNAITVENTEEETIMKKYDVEIAITNENGTIEGWDADCFQDAIEAETAAEAIEFARDYLAENGAEGTDIRVAEIKFDEDGDREPAEWIYE